MTAEGPHPPEGAEDLAGLIVRRIQELGITQKRLSTLTEIPHATINAWTTRRRGTSGGINPDVLRRLAGGLEIPARIAFEAAGRAAPGPLDEEREKKLLRLYRSMPTESQRALIQTAEALARTSRAS